MVEFRFDLRPLFTQPIVKVTSNLLPHTFRGDRRQCLDATSKMSEIIDHLGQLSASAQKLSNPVTTAQRLRMSENQIIYLMADVNAGKNGCVIGLLKVGTKDLYLFDETGQTRKVENAPSILDFYIHESRQRAGLGKDLFETMLADEKWTPVKCSVDRPSEKLLGFLKKHYGLVRTIPQANNFVLYEGFFDDGNKQQMQQQHTNGGMHITNSPNTQLFGATYLGDENNKKRLQRQLDAPNLATQITQISPAGRYGARRPTCSMAEKNGSEASLTPSQAAEQAKLSGRKHPFDALSKPSKQLLLERRSGLQDVDEEYLKQNVFRKPFHSQNSGLNDDNFSQNQMSNQMSPAAGQPSVPPSGDGFMSNQANSQEQLRAQQHIYLQQHNQNPTTNLTPQQHHQHPVANLKPSHIQMQSQISHNPRGAMAPQQNRHATHSVNHIIHSGATANKSGAEPGSNQPPTVEIVGDNLQNININDQELTEEERQQQHDEVDEDLQTQTDIEQPIIATAELEININDNAANEEHEPSQSQQNSSGNTPSQPSKGTSVFEMENRTTAPTFHLSKQHTGMKNRSYGVGMAVTPSTKMEFDQESREDFGVVKINRPIGKQPLSPNANEETMSTVSSAGEGLTDQGYYDLKFYHNKLW